MARSLVSSSDIVVEILHLFMLNDLKDAVVLSPLVVIVVLLEFGPLSLRFLFLYIINTR